MIKNVANNIGCTENHRRINKFRVCYVKSKTADKSRRRSHSLPCVNDNRNKLWVMSEKKKTLFKQQKLREEAETV